MARIEKKNLFGLSKMSSDLEEVKDLYIGDEKSKGKPKKVNNTTLLSQSILHDE